MTERERHVARYRRWAGFALWLDILIALCLIVAPTWIMGLFQVAVQPLLWARALGLLLLLVACLLIPARRDPDRYRLLAWLGLFPVRAVVVLFLAIAALGLGVGRGLLLLAIVELVLAFNQYRSLRRIGALERLDALSLAQVGSGPVEPPPPRSRWRTVAALLLLAVVALVVWNKMLREFPQPPFASIEERFKYGSIGGEEATGIPFLIWVVLPTMFPEYLPGPGGYASLGFAWEAGHDLPIGFTKKRIGFERVAINCAFCHTGVVDLPGEVRSTYYLGGPGNTYDILGYQRFLFDCGRDPRFTSTNVLNAIDRVAKLSALDRALYRFLIIPVTRSTLQQLADDFEWTDSRPDWGPGRIDPFNPVKVSTLQQVDPTVRPGDTIGNSDMVPIWNLRLRVRRNMVFHWDGLNDDITEVFFSSALGDGARPHNLPISDLQALMDWAMGLPAPPWPFDHDEGLAERGRAVFGEHCAECHADDGSRTGTIVPLAEVGTDRHRNQMWDVRSARAYNKYAEGYPWKFNGFRATEGYASPPLDAVWIRGPYLHNGSVPTLADLLEPADARPTEFYRGSRTIDQTRVGFADCDPETDRWRCFHFDTSRAGNSNAGHEWGTELSGSDKRALIEYLKTL